MILDIILATSLIISPCPQYPNEGIYRYGSHPQKQEQVIVYKKDLFKLLESITWLHLHGFKHAGFSNEDLCKAALHSKISIACGDITRFAKYLLNQQGYQSRIVQFITKEKTNGFDDGHLMIEVFHEEKWMLVDIDARRMFKKDGKYIDAPTLVASKMEGISIVKFSEAPFISYGNYNGYELWAEKQFLNEENLRAWYKRICQSFYYY